MRRFEAQHRDYDLPKDAHRVELKGSPRTLVWPELCPNCGAPAAARIVVRKIFRRGGWRRRRGWRYVIAPPVAIPFCAVCAEHHRETVRPMTRREVLASCLINPLVIPVVGATAFAIISFRPAVVDTRGEPFHWAGLAIFGFFVLTAVWSAVAAWRSTRFLRVPPPTDITRACDFSDNLGNVVLGERHVYAIRNAGFAEAFAAANRERAWTDADRKRADVVMTVWMVLVLAASLLGALWLWSRGRLG